MHKFLQMFLNISACLEIFKHFLKFYLKKYFNKILNIKIFSIFLIFL